MKLFCKVLLSSDLKPLCKRGNMGKIISAVPLGQYINEVYYIAEFEKLCLDNADGKLFYF